MTEEMEPEWYDGEPDPTVVEREPRPCRKHDWEALFKNRGEPDAEFLGIVCSRCGKEKNDTLIRRGKNNRSRGLAIQRTWLAKIGMSSIPGNGPADGRVIGANDWAVAQVKSGGRFRGADADELAKLPAKAGQTRLLLTVETPGVGRKARALVTVTLEDWRALHYSDTEGGKG